ncbi:hypothetical protein PPL_02259 [Heterostelium album PN500]|uniref:DUF7743 domain-containing protein n=1 Tax=Heterostelium pallidum (strain ATCC 26659 / Pp 5 / PN500) TaxID=670386 RepID=D3B1T5_HETP5|nr:hypothetical protein PPL_02259 [Heterostelium album PN500]EFA85259.1 hypothetical protein PPL_02259 [Heterostelium album PN500]|eukprot:XP_020437368.1 hypothetical protein PPL_02259 [Heterostelium album PN500]
MKYLFLFVLFVYCFEVGNASTLNSLKVTPGIISGVLSTTPYVNFEIVASPDVTKGILMFCETAFAFQKDSVTSVSASNANIYLCITLDADLYTLCTSRGTYNVSSLISSIQLMDTVIPRAQVMAVTATSSTFYPDASPPTISDLTVSGVQDTIYFKFGAVDQYNRISGCSVIYTTDTATVAAMIYNPVPDVNGYIYGSSVPGSAIGAIFYVSNVTCDDMYGNRFRYNAPSPIKVTLTIPPFTPLTPTLVSYSFSPMTLSNSDIAKQNTIKYVAIISEPQSQLTSVTATMLSNPCSVSFESSTVINIYCIVNPYPSTGTFSPDVTISDVNYRQSFIYLNNNGTLQITSSYLTNYQIVSTKYSTATINGLPPFTLQTNITFFSGGVPISFIKLNSFFKITPTSLVSGTLTDGVLSVLLPYDSNFSPSLNTTVFFITPPFGSGQIISIAGPPTFRPAPKVLPTITNSNPIVSLDLTAPYPSPVYGVYVASQPDEDFTTRISYLKNVNFNDINYSNKGLIIGTKSTGSYLIAHDASLGNKLANLWDVRYGNGPINLGLTQFTQFSTGSSTLYSRCTQLKLPKNIYPKIISFDYSPKALSVSNETQYVVFDLVFQNNSLVGMFDEVSILLVFKLVPTIPTPCLPLPNAIDTYKCFMPVAPGTFTNTFMVKIAISYVNGFSHIVPSEYLIMNSRANSLRFINPDPFVNYIQPVFRNLGYDSTLKQLTFKIEAVSSYITSVIVTIHNAFEIDENQQTIYTYSAQLNPSKIVQSNVSLNLPCNSKSFKYSEINLVKFTIVDVNSQSYTFITPQLQETFPTFNIPPIVCPDAFPPTIQSISYTQPLTNQVNLTIRVTDNLSGFRNMTVLLDTPYIFSKTVTIDQSNRISGNANDGVYSILINFPPPGNIALTISVPHLYDNHENDRPYLVQDVVMIGNTQPIILSGDGSVPDTPSILSTTSPSNVTLGSEWSIQLEMTGDVHQVFVDITDYYGFFRGELIKDSSSGLYVFSYYPVYVGVHYYSLLAIGKSLQSRYLLQSTNLPSFTVNSTRYTNSAPIISTLSSDTSNTYSPKMTLSLKEFYPQVGHRLRCAVIDPNNQIINGSDLTTSQPYKCNVNIPHLYSGLQKFYWSIYFEHSFTGRTRFFTKSELQALGLDPSFVLDFDSPTTTSSQTTTTTNPTTTTNSGTTTSSQTTGNTPITTATTSPSSTTGNPLNGSSKININIAASSIIILFILLLSF